MKKERFVELYEMWNHEDYELKSDLMEWYNCKYSKWDVYATNPFECIYGGIDDDIGSIVDNFSKEEYSSFLTNWKNEKEIPSPDEFEALVMLLHKHQFHSYDCAECGDDVFIGSPDSWDDFQGVSQCEGNGELCDDCYSHYLRLKKYVDD